MYCSLIANSFNTRSLKSHWCHSKHSPELHSNSLLLSRHCSKAKTSVRSYFKCDAFVQSGLLLILGHHHHMLIYPSTHRCPCWSMVTSNQLWLTMLLTDAGSHTRRSIHKRACMHVRACIRTHLNTHSAAQAKWQCLVVIHAEWSG